MNLGLHGENLIERSYLTGILIKLNREKPNFLLCCQGIMLSYWDQHFTYNNHVLVIQQMKFIGDHNKCYSNGPVGLHVAVNTIENLTIILNNSLFYNLDHTALIIIGKCKGNNTIKYIENCTFEGNINAKNEAFATPKPLIDIKLSHDHKSLSFKQCNFTRNHHSDTLISITIRESKSCHWKGIKYCYVPLITKVCFVMCQFYKNTVNVLINVVARYCKSNLLITGPSNIVSTKCAVSDYKVLYFSNMAVNITGPVIMSSNHAQSMMHFKECDVLFYNKIIFKSNNCDQVIYLQSTCIKIIKHANISLLKSSYRHIVIKTNYEDEYNLYLPCIFQFVAWRNTTVSPSLYSVNIIGNYQSDYMISDKKQNHNCSFPYYCFTPHCYWLPTAAFHQYNPKVIYQQIIKSDIQHFTYHRICHCFQNGSNNCNIDTLGLVYPGQTLPVELCTPCNDTPSTLYAEINNIHLPNSACKVAPPAQTTNIITKYSKTFNFTIIAETTKECELFLIAASKTERIIEAFYVNLSTCPVGFILQSGICDCDPFLSPYIDKCYLDYSSISRPPNTWITAHTQTNNTKYLISDCPMDYCLPYSSNVNLLYPDSQCQFNRTVILCSQCQHPLSMVFGSSRCMKCTNVDILITIIVIVAGIVLVILLYLLNLTVTIGTINGIIFYANVVSINNFVFLVNDNVFKPLRVFISFVNLD